MKANMKIKNYFELLNALETIAKIKLITSPTGYSGQAYMKAVKEIRNRKSLDRKEIALIPSVGPKIRNSIYEFLDTGKVAFIEENKHLLEEKPKVQDSIFLTGDDKVGHLNSLLTDVIRYKTKKNIEGFEFVPSSAEWTQKFLFTLGEEYRDNVIKFPMHKIVEMAYCVVNGPHVSKVR